MTFVTGTRVAGFLILIDQDGLRHAVRLHAIQALHDADAGQDQTLVALPGGRIAVVCQPLEALLQEIGGWEPGRNGAPGRTA